MTSAVLERWLADQPGALARVGREPSAPAPRNAADPMVAALERGGDSLFELFGMPPPNMGTVPVTAITSQRVAAVTACVQRIAIISTLPAQIFKGSPTGRREQIEDAPLWWLLNEQPSAAWTAASHWEWMVANLLLRGDGFSRIWRAKSGAFGEFEPLDWHDVIPARQTSGRLIYALNTGDKVTGVDQDDMLHFPGFGFDGVQGMSAIKFGARAGIGGALAMDEYAQRFFSAGAHPSIVIEGDGKMASTAIDALQTSFNNKYSGVHNAHSKPLVLTEGLKAKALSLSAEDAQLLEARRFQVIDIARAFGVPPHMIGETTASTSWGTGIEQMGRAFITYTLRGHLRRIEQELNRKLFRSAGRFIEFDRDALLEGDSKAQAEYYRAALGGPGSGPGWMCVDEIRQKKNLPPKGGTNAEIYDPRTAPKPAGGAAAPASAPTEEPAP